MKVLHLGFHKGLFNDFQYVSEQLGLDTEHLKFTDGETSGGAIYNIDHNLAKRAWNKYKDFYHSFDLIKSIPPSLIEILSSGIIFCISTYFNILSIFTHFNLFFIFTHINTLCI